MAIFFFFFLFLFWGGVKWQIYTALEQKQPEKGDNKISGRGIGMGAEQSQIFEPRTFSNHAARMVGNVPINCRSLWCLLLYFSWWLALDADIRYACGNENAKMNIGYSMPPIIITTIIWTHRSATKCGGVRSMIRSYELNLAVSLQIKRKDQTRATPAFRKHPHPYMAKHCRYHGSHSFFDAEDVMSKIVKLERKFSAHALEVIAWDDFSFFNKYPIYPFGSKSILFLK